MSTEENKAVVRRFIDTFYRRDVAAFREVTAPDLAKVAIEQWMPRTMQPGPIGNWVSRR